MVQGRLFSTGRLSEIVSLPKLVNGVRKSVHGIRTKQHVGDAAEHCERPKCRKQRWQT